MFYCLNEASQILNIKEKIAHKTLLLNRGNITYTEQEDKLLGIMKQLFRNI